MTIIIMIGFYCAQSVAVFSTLFVKITAVSSHHRCYPRIKNAFYIWNCIYTSRLNTANGQISRNCYKSACIIDWLAKVFLCISCEARKMWKIQCKRVFISKWHRTVNGVRQRVATVTKKKEELWHRMWYLS